MSRDNMRFEYIVRDDTSKHILLTNVRFNAVVIPRQYYDIGLKIVLKIVVMRVLIIRVVATCGDRDFGGAT